MKLLDRSWVSATKVTQRGHRNTKISSDNDWVWLELNMNKNYETRLTAWYMEVKRPEVKKLQAYLHRGV